MKYISGTPENIMVFAQTCIDLFYNSNEITVISDYIDKKEIACFGRTIEITRRIIDVTLLHNGSALKGMQFSGHGIVVSDEVYDSAEKYIHNLVMKLNGKLQDYPLAEP
jgi:hypothetical protein